MQSSKNLPRSRTITPHQAAHLPAGTIDGPLNDFVSNRVEQLVQQYRHLPDPNLELVALTRDAYIRGMRDGAITIGDLL